MQEDKMRKKLIVFTRKSALNSAFDGFANTRDDIKNIDNEKMLLYNESKSIFETVSNFTEYGLYLVYDSIVEEEFNFLTNDFDKLEFCILTHSRPEFTKSSDFLRIFPNVLEGTTEKIKDGGEYYPTLVDILLDNEKEKPKRFFDAVFTFDEREESRVNEIYNSIYNSISESELNYPDKNINSLLIWDNNKEFIEKLCLNWEIATQFPEDVIFSFDELKDKESIVNKDVIIILLDTNIDNQFRTSFYGLKILQYLRKDVRYKGLVVAYSVYEEQFFKGIKDAGILFTSGIRLKQLSTRGIDIVNIEQLVQKVPKLSSDLLDDITFSAFDGKGRIHEYLHNLKNDLNVIDFNKTLHEVTQNKQHIFENYKTQLLKEIDPQKIIDFNRYFDFLENETISEIKEIWGKEQKKERFSYTNSGNQVSKYSNQIADLAPVSNDDQNISEEEIIDWEVLFFDDKEDIRLTVQDFFKAKSVVCHLASNEQEVYQILKDNTPRISLFLTDIRLLDENGHWYDRQGYDVIEEVDKITSYPLVYSVLTSKKGTINKMIQKKRKYEILWFTKDDVISNIHSFNIFFDMIKKYADDNYCSNVIFQPILKAWHEVPESRKGHQAHPLKEYYKYHKTGKDYEVAENYINDNVLKWIYDAEGLKPDWNCRLKKNIDEIELDKFRKARLFGRRLALAYAADNDKANSLSIYEKLTGEKRESIDASIKGLFMTKLALSSNIESMVDQAKEFFFKRAKKVDILYEEYLFLKEEYFEEMQDAYNLGDREQKLLSDFISTLENTLCDLKIEIPPFLLRIRTIKFPKIERLSILSSFINEKELYQKANEHYRKKNQPNPISKFLINNPFKNETINIFLRQANLI